MAEPFKLGSAAAFGQHQAERRMPHDSGHIGQRIRRVERVDAHHQLGCRGPRLCQNLGTEPPGEGLAVRCHGILEIKDKRIRTGFPSLVEQFRLVSGNK